MIIDTHIHLDNKKYYEDLDEVIKRAIKVGVKGFLIPGADVKDLKRAKEISQKYDEVFFAVGTHPYDVKDFDEKILKEYVTHPKCIAIGECGLDYYRLPPNEMEKEEIKAKQKEVFIKHIEFAKKVKKPLIVHIRDASLDSKNILEKYDAKEVGGVLHCYNADEILLTLAKDGFYFGIGGVLTFSNAKKLINVFAKIPIDKLVIETDGPYLTPHPHRGERNEPSYTTFIAHKMAELLNLEYDVLCKICTDNSKRLFKEFCQLT